MTLERDNQPIKLEEMSNEELWQLFPIIISEYNPSWSNLYKEEEIKIKDALKEDVLRINHIGSTAVSNLSAKPTIDILLEIKDDTNIEELISSIVYLGYIYTSQPNNPPPNMMFMKGYTEKGFVGQAFHVHVRYLGDWDEIYFRDYLINNPEVAKEYESLKVDLMNKYKHDRDAYTLAKTDFIVDVVNKAKKSK